MMTRKAFIETSISYFLCHCYALPHNSLKEDPLEKKRGMKQVSSKEEEMKELNSIKGRSIRCQAGECSR